MEEIEAKLKIEKPEDMVKRLDLLGAEFRGELKQVDYYFDDAQKRLMKKDCGLRLRRQISGEGEKAILTYKGPRKGGMFKKREEIEIEIGSGESMEKILSKLGYEKVVTVEKKRRVWKFVGYEVAVDEVAGLGNFVEIEGDSEEKIATVQEKLGLGSSSHIKESYAQLVVKSHGGEVK